MWQYQRRLFSNKQNYKLETRISKFETNGKQNSKPEIRNSKQKGNTQSTKIQNDKSSFLETKHGTGFVHWNLEYLDLFRVWCFVFRISDFPVCLGFRYSDFGCFPRSFWISIFGFDCFGLFQISSFGIRILIRGLFGAKIFVEVVLLNILSVRIQPGVSLGI